MDDGVYFLLLMVGVPSLDLIPSLAAMRMMTIEWDSFELAPLYRPTLFQLLYELTHVFVNRYSFHQVTLFGDHG